MPTPLPDQHGKVFLVTGANSGIGFATAKGLAQHRATVVMLCRSKQKGQEAQKAIIEATGSTDVHLILADLGVQSEVRRAADEFKARFSRLDVLINNAAIIPTTREITADGIETQLAVNHLSYFLLTHLLLDLLKASAPARIVNVSSTLHARGKINFDDLQAERSYTGLGWGQYSNTKLMNHLFTFELARRLVGTGVTANCVHPGVIGTNLSRGLPKFMHRIYLAIMPKPEDGAKTSLYAATAPELANVTGQYFANSKPAKPAPASQDVAVAQQLWQVSAHLTNLAES
jgi:NAD(P)-dependent dehydrogenase (short-subunit alcohol dehydrogenase family)